ncbi:MAG: hypothetical protein ABIJ31_03665 [Pseudomonadota bacterium]
MRVSTPDLLALTTAPRDLFAEFSGGTYQWLARRFKPGNGRHIRKYDFKKAIIEAMEERKGLVYDVLQDVMEDILLVKAIQEGEYSEVVERDEIFQILDDKRSIASL